jgi:hypothetical protein
MTAGNSSVIPGRIEDANYDAQLRIGESLDFPMCNCTSEVRSFHSRPGMTASMNRRLQQATER